MDTLRRYWEQRKRIKEAYQGPRFSINDVDRLIKEHMPPFHPAYEIISWEFSRNELKVTTCPLYQSDIDKWLYENDFPRNRARWSEEQETWFKMVWGIEE